MKLREDYLLQLKMFNQTYRGRLGLDTNSKDRAFWGATFEKLYCLGEIVHNNEVIKYFKDKGLIIVDSLDEVKDNNLVIRAHGTEKNNYEIAKQKNINLFDLTCPKVLRIRELIKDYINDDSYLKGRYSHEPSIYSGGLLPCSG